MLLQDQRVFIFSTKEGLLVLIPSLISLQDLFIYAVLQIASSGNLLIDKWDKVFKNGSSKFCGYNL